MTKVARWQVLLEPRNLKYSLMRLVEAHLLLVLLVHNKPSTTDTNEKREKVLTYELPIPEHILHHSFSSLQENLIFNNNLKNRQKMHHKKIQSKIKEKKPLIDQQNQQVQNEYNQPYIVSN